MSTQTMSRDPRMTDTPGPAEVPARPERRPASRVRRTAGALLVLLALAAPLAFAAWFSWVNTDEDVNVARNEQSGVVYLRPLSQLIGVLVDSQSAAVRGTRSSPAAFAAAIAQVNAADERLGLQLNARGRWLTLRDRIAQLQRDPGTGRDAYDEHRVVIDLALDLVAQVGDGSELILDPELDSYYLMDTSLLRLPVVMVQAGRYADLLALAPKSEEAPAGQTAAGQPRQPATPDAAARSQVEQLVAAASVRELTIASADVVGVNLRKSTDATKARTLGPSVVSSLDAFRAAADQISKGAAADPTAPASTVTSAAAALRTASLRLTSAVMDTLDGLLDDRATGYQARQITVGVTLGLGVVAAFAALWLLLPSRSVTEPVEREDAYDESREIRRTASGVAQPAAADAMDEIRALLGARDLLRAGELVRVGRAVRPGRREPGGDSQ